MCKRGGVRGCRKRGGMCCAMTRMQFVELKGVGGNSFSKLS